jgi:hypothetical protein
MSLSNANFNDFFSVQNPNLHDRSKFVEKCQQNHVRVTPEMIIGMQTNYLNVKQ